VKTKNEERRKFLGVASVAAVGLAVCPIRLLEAGPAKGKLVALPMSSLEKIAKIEGHMVLELKGRAVYLVRLSKKKVGAYSAICSHEKKCIVSYTPERKQFDCHCHKSSFNLKGKPLGGPATEPLERFPTAIKGEKLIIKLPEL